MPEKKTAERQVPDHMRAVRQNKAGGALVIDTIPVPQPGPGEVLIRMHAAPINPSDLAMLRGDYLSRPYPFTPGLEGSGLVVRSGGGLIPALRIGKRVACTANPGQDGTWGEYMKTSAMRSIPLHPSVEYEQGAMMLVNPMTAMAFIHLAKSGKHKAMVNNAAASALGRMLVRLCNRQGIPLINIVRNENQVKILKDMGASVVLNSEDENFEESLKKLSDDLNASLFLDAVTGAQTNTLLRAAPRGARIVTYARLSGDPIQIDPGLLIREEKQVIGFQLGNWLQPKSLTFKLRFTGMIKKQLGGLLSTEINRSMHLEQVQEAIDLYRDNMSAGKVLLKIQDH